MCLRSCIKSGRYLNSRSQLYLDNNRKLISHTLSSDHSSQQTTDNNANIHHEHSITQQHHNHHHHHHHHHHHNHNHNHHNNSNTIPLTFLRHGQSTWNQQNIFIGMTDTPLTDDGIKEARVAGRLLASDPDTQKIDMIYTSLLRRSTKTVWHAMEEIGMEWVPVNKDWRLNERSYGALVGRNKKQCVEEYGKEQVRRWRRSWDEPPPPMTRDNKYWPGHDARYTELGIDVNTLPLSESLKDVTKRTSQFWDDVIVPQLRIGKRILIVGHENNLRSLIKRLDSISDQDIIDIELPRAIPLVYHLDRESLKPIRAHNVCKSQLLSGRYLCDSQQLQQIALRDQQQVYDLKVKETLETAPYLGISPVKHPMNLEITCDKSIKLGN